MDTRTIVNSIGILLNIIGALILLLKSPMHFDVIDLGGAMKNWNEQTKKTKMKNDWIRIGGYTIIAGSVLQLISNFLV